MRAALLVISLMILAGCAEAPIAPPTATTSSSPTPEGAPTVATPLATPTDAPPAAPAVPMPGENAVFVSGFAFVNETTTVMAGSTVTWTNMDPVTHTIAADDGSFDSGDVRPEYGSSQTFGTPGSYSYHCRIHPSMRGAIVVLGDEVVVPTPPAEPTPQPTPSTPTPAVTPTPAPATPSPPPSAPAQVNIQGFAFAPTPLAIAVGTTVRWTNLDGAPHTATANGGAFNTGTLQNGASAEHTFAAAGSFPYFCAIHPSMTGTITAS